MTRDLCSPHRSFGRGPHWVWLVAVSCVSSFVCGAETYQEYVARHKRVQKMMNPMNVPVANVLNDAWNEVPEYADPNNKPAPKKGPKDFYIKSSRDDGRLKTR